MTDQHPLVTIGLPVYNGANFIEECIGSIFTQTLTDFELIISDNGSDDATQAICEAYAKKEPRIRYFRAECNQGAAWNYNKVFTLARGKYFKWAAHDDVIKPLYIERCTEVLEKEPGVVLCYAKSALIDEQGKFLKNVDDNFERLQDRASERVHGFDPGLCHPIFGVIRRSALERTDLIGGYPDSDRILLWQLLLIGKFAEVPEVLFLRRTHPRSSVRANLDYRSRMKWFAPKRTNWWYLPTWYHVWRNVQSVSKADIPFTEKVHCYRGLSARYLLHPGWMIKDIPVAFGARPSWMRKSDIY